MDPVEGGTTSTVGRAGPPLAERVYPWHDLAVAGDWSGRAGTGLQIRPDVAIGIWTADNFRLSRVLPQTIDRTSHGHHPREGECVKTRPSQLRC